MSSLATVETETKLELNEHDFGTVLHAGSVRKRVAQLNVYFDSDWRLAALAATCRIRIGAAQTWLTVKIPVGESGTARLMREFEEPIELREWRRIRSPWRHGLDVERDLPTEARAEFRRMGLQRLDCQGWARNTRYLLTVIGLGELELDCLRLPDGRTIYEAEIEHPDLAVHRRLSEFVQSLAPSAKAVRLSKFERFRRAVLHRAEQSR